MAGILERTCLLDKPDPVAEWRRISAEQQRICDALGRVDQLRVISTATDFTMSVKRRVWENCDDRKDLPDGEVFTGPSEDSANGVVTFTFPAVSQGRDVEGLRLTFRDARVEGVHADRGQEMVEQALKILGADRLGEVTVGTNMGHQTFVRQILYDEKMGGAMHMVLGNGSPQTGRRNRSSLHWGLLLDMRRDGRIYADGRLIYERDKFRA